MTAAILLLSAGLAVVWMRLKQPVKHPVRVRRNQQDFRNR